MANKLIILGTGGNSLDIVDLVEELPDWEVLGFLDDDPGKRGQTLVGVEVLGPLEDAYRYPEAMFINGIGSSSSYRMKPEIVSNLGLPDSRWATLVHRSAWVSPRAAVGVGCVIFANAVVTTQATLGKHVTVLPNSTVSHDCQLGDYTILAGGVTLCGGVQVEANCYIGAGTSVREYIHLGQGCLVGMGSVVTRDVAPGTTVYGVPARLPLDHTPG